MHFILVIMRINIFILQRCSSVLITLQYHNPFHTIFPFFNISYATLFQLKQRIDDLDAMSEDMSSRFIEKQTDLSTFLHDYLELRKEFHTVSTKHELVAKSA